MSERRRQHDLLSDWATVELCEAQAAHRGSGMGDLGFSSPPAEAKPEAEPGCGALCHCLVLLWRSGKAHCVRGFAALSLAVGLHRRLWSSPTYTIGVLSANYFNNGIPFLWCGE